MALKHPMADYTHVLLKSDGALIRDGHAVHDSPLACLGRRVTLDPACTLRSFFCMIAAYPALQALNAFIPGYLNEVAACPREACRFPDAQGLVLHRTVEMTGYPDAAIRIYTTLEGTSGEKPCDIRAARLNQLLDMPLRLGRLRHTVFGDRIDSQQFDTSFNLFELIDGICWDLS
ncbi:MAG: hypothetical protein HKP58_02220, partial [Desulfatitalea sp.]|nr:hypothetical protein [Desulfatitalea sp.]NNJ99204.1 hypothetical protein [Desulfatitalea sp.]